MKAELLEAPDISGKKGWLEKMRWPLALAALYLISRFTILLLNYESVSDLEELLRGAIAREFMTGLKKPLSFYAADSYSGGGSIITGMLGSVFFRIFGPNYFSLKIVPVLFYSLPTLLLTFYFMKRNFGERAAALTGLFFIFSPAPLFIISMNAWGCYSIARLISACMFFILYEMLFHEKENGPGYALLGFLGSMGIWIAYPVLSTTAACAASLLIFRPRSFLGRKGLVFFGAFMGGIIFGKIAGFLPGYGPLGFFVHYVFASRYESPEILQIFHGFLEKFYRVAVLALPRSFWAGYRGLYAWEIPLSFLTLGFGLSVFSLFLKRRLGAGGLKDPVLMRCLPFFIKMLFFLLVYAVSSVPVPSPGEVALSYRYFSSSQFYGLCFFSVIAGLNRRKWMAAMVLAVVYGIGVHASLLRFISWGDVFRHKGYSYYQLGELWQHLSWKYKDMDAGPILRKFKAEENRNAFYQGFIFGYPFSKENLENFPLKELQALAPKKHKFFMEALGRYYAFENFRDLDAVAARAGKLAPREAESFYKGLSFGAASRGDGLLAFYISQLDKIPSRHHPFFYFSLGILIYNQSEPGWEEAVRIFNSFPENEKKRWVYRGMGRDAAATWIGSRMRLAKILETVPLPVPEKWQKDFCWGIGWGVRGALREDRERAIQWIRMRIPEKDQAAALKGLDSYEKWYQTGPYEEEDGDILSLAERS